MQIIENSKVTIDYEVISEDVVCDKKDGFDIYMEDDSIIEDVRNSLLGSKIEDDISISIKGSTSGLQENKDAYIKLSKDAFEGDVVVGDYYESKMGNGDSIGIQIVSDDDGVIIGSGNHSLIGKDFVVKMRIIGIEQAE